MMNKPLLLTIVVTLCCLLAFPLPGSAADEFSSARALMVQQIEEIARESVPAASNAAILDAEVLRAMATVARHEFVPAPLQPLAYQNSPLPIGYGQTISQPFIVAFMTDLLKVNKASVVLEIGTGSGYQAAVLAQLAKQVYTIEIIEPLGTQAGATLKRLGYWNAEVRIGDGYYGWPDGGQFDGIMVTAAASHIPPPLIKQLKPGGRMVIPVGSRFAVQQLVLVEKLSDGTLQTWQTLPVQFVPLTGGGEK